jgi:hypothetical protein
MGHCIHARFEVIFGSRSLRQSTHRPTNAEEAQQGSVSVLNGVLRVERGFVSINFR